MNNQPFRSEFQPIIPSGLCERPRRLVNSDVEAVDKLKTERHERALNKIGVIKRPIRDAGGLGGVQWPPIAMATLL